MCMAAKSSLGNFGEIFQSKVIFEGEGFIRPLPTTLLQMFSKIIHNFEVIKKSIKDPDKDFKNNL